MNINPQKEIFHNYNFSVYTASKYWDMKLDTYRRTTQVQLCCIAFAWLTYQRKWRRGWQYVRLFACLFVYSLFIQEYFFNTIIIVLIFQETLINLRNFILIFLIYMYIKRNHPVHNTLCNNILCTLQSNNMLKLVNTHFIIYTDFRRKLVRWFSSSVLKLLLAKIVSSLE